MEKIILEGGNVKVDGESATRLDAREIARPELMDDLLGMLNDFNKKYEKKNKHPLWKKIDKNVFSGSTQHLFDVDIDEEELLHYKPTFGDVDIKYPKEYRMELKDFLTKNKGEKFNDFVLLGHTDKSLTQWNSLFKWLSKNINVQIDFEPMEFKDLEHSVLATSNWEDLKIGVKGAYHKHLLACLDYAYLYDIIVLKGKKMIPTEMPNSHMHAFSDYYGLRKKYKLVKKPNTYIPLEPSQTEFTPDAKKIFEILFRKKATPQDVVKIKSFIGIIDLINKYFDEEQKENIAIAFLDFLWGSKAQLKYRNDPDKDMNEKMVVFQTLYERLDIKNVEIWEKAEKKIKEFY